MAKQLKDLNFNRNVYIIKNIENITVFSHAVNVADKKRHEIRYMYVDGCGNYTYYQTDATLYFVIEIQGASLSDEYLLRNDIIQPIEEPNFISTTTLLSDIFFIHSVSCSRRNIMEKLSVIEDDEGLKVNLNPHWVEFPYHNFISKVEDGTVLKDSVYRLTHLEHLERFGFLNKGIDNIYALCSKNTGSPIMDIVKKFMDRLVVFSTPSFEHLAYSMAVDNFDNFKYVFSNFFFNNYFILDWSDGESIKLVNQGNHVYMTVMENNIKLSEDENVIYDRNVIVGDAEDEEIRFF